ncbi:hypothetical protein B0H16DRAFT_1359136 [Mycena metata]|uniref:Uncharacterized protein n=1 Tax=Mycena metata TaxID=1033252 RepID=A0AAD7KA59_9AGAR|nr:hypothetical protein B0H16DRAFT_1359136 [Mycena metata]
MANITRSLQRLLPSTTPPALKNTPGNLYQVISRTPLVAGKEVHQVRWSEKHISDSFWRVTRAQFKCNGDHGKAWGQLYWKGRWCSFTGTAGPTWTKGKLVTEGRDERIRGALKYKWVEGRSAAPPVNN